MLVLVAAGLLRDRRPRVRGGRLLTTAQRTAFDLSWLVSPGSVQASLLTGMLGLQPVPTVAEVVLWVAYAVPMSLYVLWPQRPAHTVERSTERVGSPARSASTA